MVERSLLMGATEILLHEGQIESGLLRFPRQSHEGDCSPTGAKEKGGPMSALRFIPAHRRPQTPAQLAFCGTTLGSPSFFLRSISHTTPKTTNSTTGMMATALNDFSAA